MAIITLANGARYDTSTGRVVSGTATFRETAAGGSQTLTGRTTTQTAPAPTQQVVPASQLVGLRPNPITGTVATSVNATQADIDRLNARGTGMTFVNPAQQGGGGGYDDSDLRRRIKELEDAATARNEADRADASAFLRDILTQYGMGDLAGSVDQLVKDWGSTNRSVLQNKIRETESYKSRFKGLLALQQRGITDVANEAEYINLESQYRQVFRDNGVQNFLGDAGSKAEQDAIAKLVGDYSVSVNEVRDRVVDAQRVVADTPQEVRDSLQRYYNVDPATLTAYVLDPTRTSTRINQLANAAIIGGYGTRAGLQFGTQAAERIGEFLSGGENLRGSQIEPQLTEIADVQRATERLAQIEKSELSAEETALSQLNLDVTARQKVKELQSRERARFGGSSAITQGTLGRSQNI